MSHSYIHDIKGWESSDGPERGASAARSRTARDVEYCIVYVACWGGGERGGIASPCTISAISITISGHAGPPTEARKRAAAGLVGEACARHASSNLDGGGESTADDHLNPQRWTPIVVVIALG